MKPFRVNIPLLCAALLGLTLSACQNGVLNGESRAGSPVGQSFNVQGYYVKGGVTVQMQVLATPTSDPGNSGNWINFGNPAVTSASPLTVNGDNLYSWSNTVVPVPTANELSRWPDGGLLKMRAMFIDGSNVNPGYTYDTATYSSCLGAGLQNNTPGQTIGIQCQGIAHTYVAVASSDKNPADLQTREFLGLKGDISTTETQNYYNAWGAPPNLGAFRTSFGYPGTTGDLTTVYYNDTDLGLAREMHCWKAVKNNTNFTACYVSNYTNTGGFGDQNDIQASITKAITGHSASPQGTGAVATVAMVYAQPVGSATRGTVNFVVYGPGPSFNQQLAAKLDNSGKHTSVPNNCLNCHGVDTFYDASSHSVKNFGTGAQFLPFAVPDFQFSTSNASFNRAAQEATFAKLNALINNTTQPTTAINSLITHEYASNSTIWDDSYVPSDWNDGSTQVDQSLYTGVVRQFCRSCHISAGTERDFATLTNWNNHLADIKTRACQTSSGTSFMPHAEHPMRKFWASGRAFINEWTGDLSGCQP